MIIGVGKKINSKYRINVGTHNGIFHVDEVVGIAILMLAFLNTVLYVVRTRSLEILNKLNIVIDIGGGEFDHHMEGFNTCRSTGEKYASAGLVWRVFGKGAIKAVLKNENISINDSEIDYIFKKIDKEVIIPVDLEDNGISTSIHTFSFVTKYHPSWMKKPNYNAAFKEVVQIVSSILYKLIMSEALQIAAKHEIEARLKVVDDGILEIPSQTMSWTEAVVEHNKHTETKVKFVIFPYPAGGWAAQCVPPSMEEKFKQIIPFPKTWAGKKDQALSTVSGIKDAILCHNGRFFVRAESRESVIQMCKIAMK